MIVTSLIWIALTVTVFKINVWLYRKARHILLTPLIVTPAILIVILLCLDIPVSSYNQGGKWLSSLVEPATIALAVTLYKYVDVLKKHAGIIVISVMSGAIIAIITSAGLAGMLGLSIPLIDSLAPRSVTTSIAMPISDRIGGIPTITAVATLITGIISMILGPLVMKWFHIQSSLSRGILLGTSSHSSGVSKAFEYDNLSGSIATVAMMLTAFITVGVAPWIVGIILHNLA